jgi:hypothetical protein
VCGLPEQARRFDQASAQLGVGERTRRAFHASADSLSLAG